MRKILCFSLFFVIVTGCRSTSNPAVGVWMHKSNDQFATIKIKLRNNGKYRVKTKMKFNTVHTVVNEGRFMYLDEDLSSVIISDDTLYFSGMDTLIRKNGNKLERLSLIKRIFPFFVKKTKW